MELGRDEKQRKRERACIYGERAQLSGHFVKERLMNGGRGRGPACGILGDVAWRAGGMALRMT
jgi:hypothetical protein